MSKNRIKANDKAMRNLLSQKELDQLFKEEQDRFISEFSGTMGSSPISRLLEVISQMPAIREEKVSDIRRQISDSSYDLDRRLDTAMEKVFEEYLI